MKNFPFIIITLLFISCAPVQKSYPISEAELFNTTVPAVVVVRAFNENYEMVSQGTGFVINSTGTIATNYHVIDNSYSLKVSFMNGEKYDVNNIVAVDEHRDIAIIAINGYDLPKVSLGNSNKLSIGEKVISIGNPLGLSNTLSTGIISGIRTDIGDYKLIQTTAPISPGSSGGPLLNMDGEVIAITTMHLQGGQNLNFAVPINYLIALSKQEIKPTQISYSSKDLELKKELAEKYYYEDEYLKAAELLLEITKEDSTDSEIFFKLGFSLHRIAVNLGPHNDDDPRWEQFASQAIVKFRKAVELDPENEFGYLKIARVYGLWMIDAIKNKRPAQLKEALQNAQQSGGFFPFVLESNRAILTSCSENSILFTSGDDDTFPMWYLQEIEKVRNDVVVINLGLLGIPFYVRYLRDFKGIDFNLTDDKIENLEAKDWPRPRDLVIKLDGIKEDGFYVENIRLNINHSYIDEDYDYLSISDQLVIEILKKYINDRDIYLSKTISWLDHSVPFSLYNHTVSEGLVHKIVKQPTNRIKSYNRWENNLMKNFRYSIFSDPRIFGENISYNFIHGYRSSFNDLAKIYHYRANQRKVREILQFKDDVIPRDNIPIPFEQLKEMYQDGEIKELYDFAGVEFNEFDLITKWAQEKIETSWEPAALDTPYYYYRIGEYYLDINDIDNSQNYVEEYLKYEPDDKEAKATLMYIDFEKDNYSRALSIANEFLKDDPEDIYINTQLGQHFTSQKEYDKAGEYFEKVLYVNDRDYDVYNSYGLLNLYQHNYLQALDYFEKVLEYAPNYAANSKYAMLNIGDTYKAMGENNKAISVYEKLIEIDPTMCLAYSKLAILYDLDNDLKKSNDLLQIAKDNMWEDSYGQMGLACYYSHKGDVKIALSYLETAIEMNFTDFDWLEFDPDLKNIRETRKFKSLIK